MKPKPDHKRLYEIAEEQAGYFTTTQAHQAGFSSERLSSSTKSGRFLRVAAGVYRLEQFPHHPHEDLFYAWLAAGPQTVISHESALAYYDLSDVIPSEIHVIVPRTASRRKSNMRMHTHSLTPDEITTRDGLRITTVARTLADVAVGRLAEEQVRQAVREALERGMVSSNELIFQAEKRGGRFKKTILEMLNQRTDW